MRDKKFTVIVFEKSFTFNSTSNDPVHNIIIKID